MKIILLTHWINKELVCCCPISNRCRKDHNCEELEFTLEPFSKKDVLECFKNSDKRK